MTAPVAAVVPAKDEAARVAATVAALRSLAPVDLVVVVDDGSTDGTHLAAAAAVALVVRHHRNRGKAGALTTGLLRVREEETRKGGPAHLLLFADADLEGSASALGPLLDPVREGTADLSVANLPPGRSSQGGGRVVRYAQDRIADLTGTRIAQPLNGMRCLDPTAVAAATPFAPGWGVEAAMLVDVLRAGLRVVEVPVSISHRRTGTDWRGQLHRARQLRDVALALRARRER